MSCLGYAAPASSLYEWVIGVIFHYLHAEHKLMEEVELVESEHELFVISQFCQEVLIKVVLQQS